MVCFTLDTTICTDECCIVLRHRLLKRDKKRVRRQAQLKRRRVAQAQIKSPVYQLRQTITHFFPGLYERVGALTDCRRKSVYELSEIIMAGVALFLIKGTKVC